MIKRIKMALNCLFGKLGSAENVCYKCGSKPGTNMQCTPCRALRIKTELHGQQQ